MDVNLIIDDLVEGVEWSSDEAIQLAQIAEELKTQNKENEESGKVRITTDFGWNYACFNVWSDVSNRENPYEHKVKVERLLESYSIVVNAGVSYPTQDFDELIELTRDHLWPAI